MPAPIIEIDAHSGFCFGVTTAIEKAEEHLSSYCSGPPNDPSETDSRAASGCLYCLGDIVHNDAECARLARLGLITVSHADLPRLGGCRLLLRAHGEPPSTYQLCQQYHISLIDATCPVVLNLQRKIRTDYQAAPETQIVIYGKRGHAEVVGLVGQTDGHAIVVEQIDDLDSVDFSQPVHLYSQTTQSVDGFRQLVEAAHERAAALGMESQFQSHDTICRQVHGRTAHLCEFALRHDALLFVSGRKSSNGQALLRICRQVNPQTYHVEAPADIQPRWFATARSIGICGATSTPKWLMEQCREAIARLQNSSI